MNSPRQAILNALRMVAATWPQIRVEKPTVAAWETALRQYTDDQIRIGVELVIRYHEHGPPAPAHVGAMIRGKTVKRLTDSVYAAHYAEEQQFAWEEHGDDPPLGMSQEEARGILLEGSLIRRLPEHRERVAIDDSRTQGLGPISGDLEDYR